MRWTCPERFWPQKFFRSKKQDGHVSGTAFCVDGEQDKQRHTPPPWSTAEASDPDGSTNRTDAQNCKRSQAHCNAGAEEIGRATQAAPGAEMSDDARGMTTLRLHPPQPDFISTGHHRARRTLTSNRRALSSSHPDAAVLIQHSHLHNLSYLPYFLHASCNSTHSSSSSSHRR